MSIFLLTLCRLSGIPCLGGCVHSKDGLGRRNAFNIDVTNISRSFEHEMGRCFMSPVETDWGSTYVSLVHVLRRVEIENAKDGRHPAGHNNCFHGDSRSGIFIQRCIVLFYINISMGIELYIVSLVRDTCVIAIFLSLDPTSFISDAYWFGNISSLVRGTSETLFFETCPYFIFSILDTWIFEKNSFACFCSKRCCRELSLSTHGVIKCICFTCSGYMCYRNCSFSL